MIKSIAANRAEPATINPRDEQLLGEYFAGAASRNERSAFGPMLERMERYGFGSVPCLPCEGHGIQADGQWCRRCQGTGALAFERKGSGLAVCQACHGTRKGRQRCRECAGLGVRQLTATPKTVTADPAVHVPDVELLERYAGITRRLNWVSKQSRICYHALALYYGDAGARWGRTEQGRIFSLYELTRPGQKLAGWKRDRNAPVLSTGERIGVQAVVQRTQPDGERKRLLLAAADAALTLYNQTCELWQASLR